MAFDEALADRCRPHVLGRPGGSEKKMFGGVCFLVHGNMACGVVKDELMVRVGPDAYADALARPHARPMDFTGRPLKGMVYVGAEGVRTASALEAWVRRGIAYAEAQPPKVAGAKKKSGAKKKAGAKAAAAAKRASSAKQKPTAPKKAGAKKAAAPKKAGAKKAAAPKKPAAGAGRAPRR